MLHPSAVLSSMPTFFMCTLKIPVTVIEQINKYGSYCLWRGSDINAKKPPKVAWKLVCQPKSNGGLGVLDLEVQNDALLLKNLHKFFNKADVPWVRLIWNNYYKHNKLPTQV